MTYMFITFDPEPKPFPVGHHHPFLKTHQYLSIEDQKKVRNLEDILSTAVLT